MEFLQVRLNAQRFTEDLTPSATLMVGLAVDSWPLHLKPAHVGKLQTLRYPIVRPEGGSAGTTTAPARVVLSFTSGEPRVMDLKAPVQTDPFRLTRKYHQKCLERRARLTESPETHAIRRHLQQLTEISTDKKVKTSRVKMVEFIPEIRALYRDDPDVPQGEAGYLMEANGTCADQFIRRHPTDERSCMYAAKDVLERELRRMGEGHANVVVISEDPVRAWSIMGVPSGPALVAWDLLTDPVLAHLYYTNGQEPRPLETSESFVRSHDAFVRSNLPLSEVYSRCGKTSVRDDMRLRSTAARAVMTRDLAIQVFDARTRLIPERDVTQVIHGSLKTCDAVLRDRFLYPSASRGEAALPLGTQVPRLADPQETRRNALVVEARRAHCRREQCCQAATRRLGMIPAQPRR